VSADVSGPEARCVGQSSARQISRSVPALVSLTQYIRYGRLFGPLRWHEQARRIGRSGRARSRPDGLAKLTRPPAGHWTRERAATDIITLAREGRAFASLNSLIARQGGRHVLYGSALALAAALQAWSRHAGTPLTDLARTTIR